MTARNLLSCAIAGILTLASLHAAPQFRSLTPGNQSTQSSSGWVQHLNRMDEAERQRRVHTYGMPPAPPNRWANRVPNRPVVQQQQQQQQQQPAPPVRNAPQSLYQNRPPVVAPIVRPPARAQSASYLPPTRQAQPVRQPQSARYVPPVRQAHPVRQAQPARESNSVRQAPPVRKAKPVRFIPPKPKAQPVLYKPPTRKVEPVKQTTPAKRSRLLSWKPSQLKSKPKPVSREETLRQQVAFMPTNSTRLPKANPYAPFASRAEYDQAIRRSKWEPRARSAKILADQQKRPTPSPQAKPTKKRWSIGSIFRRKKAAPGAKPQKRSSGALETRSDLSPRVPNSKYVIAGLPQSSNRSGAVIETTLLGN